MVCPSNFVWSAFFFLLVASTWRCEATSVVTCMLCTVITEPLEKDMTPTATVTAMLKKCDKMGLMEPVCVQFVSENVKEVFLRVRQGIPPSTVCQMLRFCDLQ
ncbi:unnamed protein product [Caenorhabditis sp. 36 PRJEB53466]|nr:unnamed protein product [Caenorhabditis sp. 36 PRJEB53466]